MSAEPPVNYIIRKSLASLVVIGKINPVLAVIAISAKSCLYKVA